MSDSPVHRDEVRGASPQEKRPRSPVPDSPREERRGRSRSSGSRHNGRRQPSRSPHGRDAEDAGNVVYVAKLSRSTRESDLRDGFSRFGTIRNIALKLNYAFITYEKPESAREAIERMNGAKFVNDEQLVVEQSGNTETYIM